jgi:hypothetical protein
MDCSTPTGCSRAVQEQNFERIFNNYWWLKEDCSTTTSCWRTVQRLQVVEGRFINYQNFEVLFNNYRFLKDCSTNC